MNGLPLPRDHEERENFDQQDAFILGDPAACFDRPCGHHYDRKSDNPYAGYPVWKKIFSYILRGCGYLEDYDTIYVLVDIRNLADHTTRDPGLPHWPAVVAWWESRLQMTGPMQERTELCFFLASEATGLHNVHPTWAGTFVLAALGASFPGKHFFLLDSDCLPVTLFEAFDLWQEAYLTRFPLGAEESRKMPHPLLQHQRFRHDCYVRDTREGTSHQKMGQGVVLVTEPHAELNAGFVGLFASGHSAIFNWAQWNTQTKNVVDQDAHAADRKKVHAEVIQVASHEVDTDSDKDQSIVATSDSEGSESASESEQNDPPSSLASDAEQYMSACKPPILQLVVTLTTKRPSSDLSTTSSSVWSWFLNDGPLRDSPSLCKNVLTILTRC